MTRFFFISGCLISGQCLHAALGNNGENVLYFTPPPPPPNLTRAEGGWTGDREIDYSIYLMCIIYQYLGESNTNNLNVYECWMFTLQDTV
jgi:hypothetical protein